MGRRRRRWAAACRGEQVAGQRVATWTMTVRPRTEPMGWTRTRVHPRRRALSMTDKRQTERKLENLELNKETMQELAERETEQVKGGVRGDREPCPSFPSVYVQCL